MVRSLLLAGLMALTGSALAGEQVDIKPPTVTKADRIAQVKRKIESCEARIRQNTDAVLAREEKTHPESAAVARKIRAQAEADLPVLKTELGWLEGRITLAGCEKSVKALEESLAKAKEPEKAGAQAALDAARLELERVKKLEASKDF